MTVFGAMVAPSLRPIKKPAAPAGAAVGPPRCCAAADAAAATTKPITTVRKNETGMVTAARSPIMRAASPLPGAELDGQPECCCRARGRQDNLYPTNVKAAALRRSHGAACTYGRFAPPADSRGRRTRVMNRGLLFLVLLIAGAAAAVRATIAQPAAAPKPGEVFRDCADCAEMVVVPPGEFEMGGGDAPYEKPQHKVTIAHPFAIGRGEASFDEWDLCYSAGGCTYRPDDHGWGRGNRPVIGVSWDDAKVFLAWLSRSAGKNYRLATEAEWEYAARGGSASPYWWGRDAGKRT